MRFPLSGICLFLMLYVLYCGRCYANSTSSGLTIVHEDSLYQRTETYSFTTFQLLNTYSTYFENVTYLKSEENVDFISSSFSSGSNILSEAELMTNTFQLLDQLSSSDALFHTYLQSNQYSSYFSMSELPSLELSSNLISGIFSNATTYEALLYSTVKMYMEPSSNKAYISEMSTENMVSDSLLSSSIQTSSYNNIEMQSSKISQLLIPESITYIYLPSSSLGLYRQSIIPDLYRTVSDSKNFSLDMLTPSTTKNYSHLLTSSSLKLPINSTIQELYESLNSSVFSSSDELVTATSTKTFQTLLLPSHSLVSDVVSSLKSSSLAFSSEFEQYSVQNESSIDTFYLHSSIFLSPLHHYTSEQYISSLSLISNEVSLFSTSGYVATISNIYSQEQIFSSQSSELISPTSSYKILISESFDETIFFFESSSQFFSELTNEIISNESFVPLTTSVSSDDLLPSFVISNDNSKYLSLISSSYTFPEIFLNSSLLSTIFYKDFSSSSASSYIEWPVIAFSSFAYEQPTSEPSPICVHKEEFQTKVVDSLTEREKNEVVTIHLHPIQPNMSLIWCEEQHYNLIKIIADVMDIKAEIISLVYIIPRSHYEELVMIVVTFFAYTSQEDELISGHQLTLHLRNETAQFSKLLHLIPKDIYNGLPLKFTELPNSSLFQRHAGLLITVIVLAAWCLIIIIIGVIYVKRYYNRGAWANIDYIKEKDVLDRSPLEDIVIHNPNSDDEIIKDESQMLEKRSYLITVNGENSRLLWQPDDGWIIPYDDLTEEQNVTKIEDTKL